MNKRYIITGCLCIALVIGYIFMNYPKTSTEKLTNGRAVCFDDWDKIDEELSKEEDEQVKKIYNKRSLYNDIPSCGFDNKVGFKFIDENGKETIFAIALDHCGAVYDKNNKKYFSISDDERKQIDKIFSAHNIEFPRV